MSDVIATIEQRALPFPGGEVEWFLVPWDSEILGFAVAQISKITIQQKATSQAAKMLSDCFRREGVQLVSARLPVSDLQSSMLLELAGFRFVEVTCQPVFSKLNAWPVGEETGIEVVRVTQDVLAVVEDMAGRVFRNERFYVDPRLNPLSSDERYRHWVRSAFGHPQQSLYALLEKNTIIGFFVTEDQPSGRVYWHLTAIAPEYQGGGYGRRAWKEMMQFHQQAGQTCIATTIVTRNIPVLNLYASLGFRFTQPEMGFHWWAGEPT